MGVHKQLTLAFLAVLAASGVGTLVMFACLGPLLRTNAALVEVSELHASAARLERAVGKLGQASSLLLRGERSAGRQLIAEGRDELARSLAELERLPVEPLAQAELDEVKLFCGAAEAASTASLSLSAGVGDLEAQHFRRAIDLLETRTRALTVRVETFADHAQARAQAVQVSAQHLARSAQLVGAGTVALALLLSLGLSVVLARRIAGPIEHLAAIARRVGNGDLTARAEGHLRGELGSLGCAFNTMVDDLRTTHAAVVRAERLAAIGELTVALKHEFNNSLQGLTGVLSALLDQPQDLPEPTRNMINMAGEEVARMCGVMAKLDRVSAPVSTTYLGNTRMLDIDESAGT